MIFLDELKDMILYKKQFHIPINEKNKRKGSSVVLVTPNINSSINTINHKLMINKYHRGYYIEKDVAQFINSMVLTENMSKTEALDVLNEEYSVEEASLNYTAMMKKMLYEERFRRGKDIFPIYDEVKAECPFIKYTYLKPKRYKGFNIFSDFFYYNELFFKNNMLKNDKGIDLYFEFLSRFINSPDTLGYKQKTVVIPVNDWYDVMASKNFHMYTNSINPISVIYRLLKRKDIASLRKVWGGTTFVFMGVNGYFKIDFDKYDERVAPKFLSFINKLSDSDYVPEEDDSMDKESNKSIKYNTIERIDRLGKVKIDNLTGEGETTQAELIKKIDDASLSSKSDSEVLDKISQDNQTKEMIQKVIAQSNNTVDRSIARTKRMDNLKNKFGDIAIDGKTVHEIIDSSVRDLPKTGLNVDTINEEWENLKFINFDNSYDIEMDLFNGFNHFSDNNKKYPLGVRDIKKDDTSTSEDYIDTYTLMLEDINGKRYQAKLDIPQFVDDKFLMLKGNKKAIVKQIVLLPIVKTGNAEVQVVSNYNKILVRRFGSKGFIFSDLLLKKLKKIGPNGTIKMQVGDATKKNNKYGGVPIDYAELASEYVRLEGSDYIVYLNQEEIRNKYDIDESKGMPFAYAKKDKMVIYHDEEKTEFKSIADHIDVMLSVGSLTPEEREIWNNTKNVAKKYSYSRAKILNTEMPLIVVLAYSEGLLQVLDKAKIDYEITEKRPKQRYGFDTIRFQDAFLTYDITYESSLLMNGLKEVNTRDYTIEDLKSRSTYLDWLDIFGERINADGIGNFYELMIDPITREVLRDFNLPTDYTEVMIYASNLLADTSKVSHTNMKGRRIRSNEIVAALSYKVMADAYGEYKRNMNRGKKDAKFSIDQKAVVKKLLELRTVSDNSILNAALEAETLSAVSYKGPSGLNTERAYGLDKRAYDPTMQNVIAMSTINSANVGINRQLTIDSNIEGTRGYVKTIDSPDELNVSKTFTFSEALTPFGPNRDEPTRTSMTYTQSKHGMRVKKANPLLVSNGSDQALPYFISNTFAFKAKDKGKIVEKNDDLMIIEYANGAKEFVNLKTNVEKNSSSGFYTPIKLETKLKKGSLVKKGQIVAHDPVSFSGEVGPTNDLSYNIGTLVKVAMLNSDEGFEDSSIISEGLSDSMASEVVVKKEVSLGKNAGIYKMVKVGDKLQEGDPLLTIQNSYEEEDVNILLRNLVDDEDVITDLGRRPVKSKITGTVEAIKAYRTVPLKDLSPSLRKKVKEIEAPIKEAKAIIKKYDMDYAEKYLDADYELEPTGKLKSLDEGVLLEFYLKYEDKMSVGDKLTYFAAIKGVVRDIFPAGDEPYTEYRPDENIDAILALGSLQSRMTFSIKIHMLTNKAIIELGRQVKDILDIKY